MITCIHDKQDGLLHITPKNHTHPAPEGDPLGEDHYWCPDKGPCPGIHSRDDIDSLIVPCGWTP